jgi:large subunit ribosomal protein L18
MKLKTKQDYRERRHKRLRRKILGSADRPRMAVYLSGRHIYVQFIDDMAARTLASASTLGKASKGGSGKNDVKTAKDIGKLAAEKAKEKGIERVVFDRGGFKYGGRIKALADAAREAGLKF